MAEHKPQAWAQRTIDLARSLSANGATAGEGMRTLKTGPRDFFRLSRENGISWKGANAGKKFETLPGTNKRRQKFPKLPPLEAAKQALAAEIAAAKAEQATAPLFRPVED